MSQKQQGHWIGGGEGGVVGGRSGGLKSTRPPKRKHQNIDAWGPPGHVCYYIIKCLRQVTIYASPFFGLLSNNSTRNLQNPSYCWINYPIWSHKLNMHPNRLERMGKFIWSGLQSTFWKRAGPALWCPFKRYQRQVHIYSRQGTSDNTIEQSLADHTRNIMSSICWLAGNKTVPWIPEPEIDSSWIHGYIWGVLFVMIRQP